MKRHPMAKNIATPSTSSILGTIAKFFRLTEKEGVTLKDFQYIIDSRSARKELTDFMKNISLKKELTFCVQEEIKNLVVQYYQEIFCLDLNIDYPISEMKFTKEEGFNSLMVAGHPALHRQEDKIIEAFVKKWGVGVTKYLSPVAGKINHHVEQPRPGGLYLFAHRGGNKPDIQQDKTYESIKNEGLLFLNAEEYLLCSGFHKFTKGRFMDKNGLTKTSSRWYGDSTVDIGWNSVGNRLDLVGGSRIDFLNNQGLREIIFS